MMNIILKWKLMTKVNSLKIFTDSASLLKKMYKAGKSTVGDLHSLNDGPEGTIT